MSKVVEAANKTVRANVPADDEALPTGSIIHWPELHSSLAIPPKTVVPVTCGNPWGNVKCKGKRDIPVARGMSGAALLSSDCLANSEGNNFTGLCGDCLQRKNRPDQKLPSGSVLLWSQISQEALPIICGKCGKKWILKHGHVSYKGSGYCPHHLKRTDDVNHPSGTVIHWGQRHAEEVTLIGITCHRCKKDSFAWHAEVTRPDWRGLCRECTKLKPPHNKHLDDEELSSGSIIHWRERDPNNSDKAMVSCGLCRRVGKVTKRLMHTSAYRRWKTDKRAGHCPDHYSDPDALVAMLQPQAQNGSGQKDGKRKKPGPKKDVYAFITWQNMGEAFKRVDGFPTKPTIAKALGVSVSGIDKWMQRERVNWRDVQRRFINT